MKNRLDSLDLLRGIAVLTVCFCHFGAALLYRNAYTSVFNAFYDCGRLGVYMFFIVSGFIIPLSLHKGNFCISNYFTFLQKRVIRLHTPYLLALAASLIIMFLAAYLANRSVPENFHTIVQSAFYAHIPYNNPVFWTLIVEWQYYFFIGIFYCLVARYPQFSVGIVIPALLLISHMQWLPFINFFSFIVFFLIGNVGFLIYTKQGNTLLNKLMLAGLIVFSFCFYGLAAALISLFAILFILFYKRSIPKPLLFTGKISYSVYLLHYPISVKFLGLPFPILQQQPVWTLFIIALFMSLVLSYFFYKWVEVPSEKFASKFIYGQEGVLLKMPQLI